MHERVETVARLDGRRVHRFQVVRERRDEEGDAGAGGDEEWIVVEFGDDEVSLADPEFDRSRSVPTQAFRSGRFEPLSAGGVPVWGY